MADSTPISWAYPFKTTEASVNPLQYLTHMAKANDGFYPTGENGLWHGGVHFDKGTAAVFDQSSVRCIADGEVIAYRVNETYPISEYTEAIPQIKRVPFSSGFVLVKHRLQPPQPSKGAATASEQSPPTLTFYSLYMHLQDWAGYQAKADLPRPGFWEAATYIVNTKDQGLNVRAEPNANGTELAVLSKGAQITAGSPEGDFCKLLSIINGTAEPALTPDSEGKLPGFVAFKLLKAQHEPKAKDSVVVLPPGISIKAGDLIGHLGTYQNHNGAAQPLLHLEVFSCEDVPGFISKSQAWARSLPDTEKTLLKVHKDASRLIAHRDDIKADNPPKLDDAGSQIGVDLIIPQALLDGLPAANKIKVSTTIPGSNTAQTTHWWRLDGLLADKDGNPINGWLAEQDLITTRHSPWEWPDFHCIEDTGTPVEKLAYTFNARGMLSDDEKQNYRAQISKADGGPILAIARLYDIVDTDEDGVLTRDEIRTALGKPWHAQVLGQLISKYESEWFWNKSKWDELDPLLAEEPGKPNLIWEVEKQRIEKLSWWKELAGQHGISGDGKAWHFHPTGTIGCFYKSDTNLITMEMLQITKPSSDSSYYEEILPYLNEYADAYEVNTPIRIAHFLAQVGHESGFRVRSEDGSYSATRMREIFGCIGGKKNYNKATDECSLGRLRNKLWTDETVYTNNPRKLLSFVYSSRMGNGDEASEEGYKFRGRGIIQLTGKNNYRKYTEIHNNANPSDVKDFVENPDLIITTVKYGVESGFVYWAMVNANKIADANDSERLTIAINGGMNGYDERIECLEKLKTHLGL